MSNKGKKYKTRKDVIFNDEICQWVRERTPCKEHGYQTIEQILADLNSTFSTNFSNRAFRQHCYEKGLQLGFVRSQSTAQRGEKNWRRRPVGALQHKKGYLYIKIAEPSVWVPYHRHIWEQAHPGESLEGKVLIFLDGNTENCALDNLECITKGELALMAELERPKDATAEETKIYLLRARVLIAKKKLLGDHYQKAHSKAAYEKFKNTPAYKARTKKAAERAKERYNNDPEYREKILKRNNENRRKRRQLTKVN